MQIGTFLERADGVVRLLLTRLACEPPAPMAGRSHTTITPWSVLLRALSAFEIFRRVSRDSVTPTNVLAFTIFRPDVPRSVYRSTSLVYENLQAVREHTVDGNRAAGRIAARVAEVCTLDSVPPGGVEQHLNGILATTADLSERIGRDFLGHSPAG